MILQIVKSIPCYSRVDIIAQATAVLVQAIGGLGLVLGNGGGWGKLTTDLGHCLGVLGSGWVCVGRLAESNICSPQLEEIVVDLLRVDVLHPAKKRGPSWRLRLGVLSGVRGGSGLSHLIVI